MYVTFIAVMARYMKSRQKEAAIEQASFADFSISDIIFGRHASRYIHWLLISSVPTTSMREVSSERYKNLYPGSTSGIYQHRRGAADFLFDLLVYSISVELRRGIPLGWRLLALFDRDEIRAHEEVNYPFSEVFSKKFLKEIPSKGSVSVSYRIHYGRTFLIATFNFLSWYSYS